MYVCAGQQKYEESALQSEEIQCGMVNTVQVCRGIYRKCDQYVTYWAVEGV